MSQLRKIIRYVRSSPQHQAWFMEIVKFTNTNQRNTAEDLDKTAAFKLILDDETRWSSTLKMFR